MFKRGGSIINNLCNSNFQNLSVKDQLIKSYGYICFLGGNISKKNILTVHELVPRRNGGRRTFYNSVLLARLQHDMFNRIETYNKFIADELNDGFIEYKSTKDYLIIQQMKDFVENWIESNGFEITERKKSLMLVKKK